MNRLFVSSLEYIADWRKTHTEYYFPKVETKDYNVITDEKKSFSSASQKYENIRKVATDWGHDYATGCLLDCPYFGEN